MLVLGKPFQPSLLLLNKAGAYPKLEHLKDKHSSLLRKSVNYDSKKFYSTSPRSFWSRWLLVGWDSFW
jgi:hypothetical protein